MSGQLYTGDVRYKPSPYSAEIKDQAELIVLYNISYLEDKNQKIDTQAILQMGNSYSKFFSTITLKKDSLSYLFSKKEYLGSKEINELGKLNIGFKKNILKDLLNQKIINQKKLQQLGMNMKSLLLS